MKTSNNENSVQDTTGRKLSEDKAKKIDEATKANAELFANFNPDLLRYMSATSFYDDSSSYSSPSLGNYKPLPPSKPKPKLHSPTKPAQPSKASNSTNSFLLPLSPSEKTHYLYIHTKPHPDSLKPRPLTLDAALNAISIPNPIERNIKLADILAADKKTRDLPAIPETSSASSYSRPDDDTDSTSEKPDELGKIIANNTKLRAENYELERELKKQQKELWKLRREVGLTGHKFDKTEYSKMNLDKLLRQSKGDLDAPSSTPQRSSTEAKTISRPRWRGVSKTNL